MQYDDSYPFLTEPTHIPELNDWVTTYLLSQRRFTFTEAEVLQPYWDQGEDILLREDSRFQNAILPDSPSSGQWQLCNHTVANELIYDSLLNDKWNGEDLYQYLQELDRQEKETTFHIFCVSDKRFSLSQNQESRYHIDLSREIAKVTLSAEQKNVLDSLARQLLDAFPYQSRTPWPTSKILEQIKYTSPDSLILKHMIPATVTQWLQQRDEWAKVGRDLWFPKQLLAPPIQNRRYAVLSIDAGKQRYSISFRDTLGTDEKDTNKTMNQEENGADKHPRSSQQTVARSKWKVALRTLHLNEGYIPIPSHARTFYLYSHKLNNPVALSGIWFADASKMTVWLDTTHHRIYGPDIMDQLAFLDAGTILEVSWSDAGLAFNIAGSDPEIFEEEARLIDLTELAQLRSTVLESYRASLRVLLTSANEGKNFAELYQELCQRQQHKPNRSTIRTILSSSPEFCFEKFESKWKLLSDVTEETSASTLRKIAVTAQQAANKDSGQSSNTLSLTEMIARNRQQLTDLRHIYGISK